MHFKLLGSSAVVKVLKLTDLFFLSLFHTLTFSYWRPQVEGEQN